MMLDLKSLVDMMSIGTLMAYMIVRLERKFLIFLSIIISFHNSISIILLTILVCVFSFFITKLGIQRTQNLQSSQSETPIRSWKSGMILMVL